MSMETMITLLRVTHMELLSSISPSSSLLKLPLIAIYWATCGTQLWNWPSLSKKRQNGGRLTQKARVSWPTLLPPPPLQWGPTFTGRGRVTDLVWRTDLELDLELTQNYRTELFALYLRRTII